MTFEEIGRSIGKLVDEKNQSYGNSFAKSGDVFRIWYPDGIRPDQYDDMLLLVRILDKQFRIATQKEAFAESPWKDIAGYGICGFSMIPDAEPAAGTPEEKPATGWRKELKEASTRIANSPAK